MRFHAITFVAAAVGLTSGCVTKNTHEALQREFDQTRQQLSGEVDERNAQIASLQAAIAEQEQVRATQDQHIEGLEVALEQREAELDSTRAIADEAEAKLATALASSRNMRAAVDEMKAALREAGDRRLATEARIAEYRRVLAKFKRLIDSGTLKVEVIDGRMVLVLPMDVLFASGRAQLSEAGTATISDVGVTLATFAERRFQVEGHTDTVPISTSRYRSNWELASARAQGVLRALLAAGVSPDALSAASYGEHRPTATNDDEPGRAKNRRIEISIVPDLSGLPGYDELNQLARPK